MTKLKKVLITTVPFGEVSRASLDMLESHNISRHESSIGAWNES